jgi:uncharacterized caspase-like protein
MRLTLIRHIAFLACWIISIFSSGQQNRGFGEISQPGQGIQRQFALIVGVSDYQYVTPLNYATNDALLMYEFLLSNAGGHVPKNNISLLLDAEATASNVWSRGLSWLERTVRPTKGDRIYIYLAGHGDAISSQEAFFLCADANPAGDKNNYYATPGVLDLNVLKISIANFTSAGAEVILIMDACRSGDLPGIRTGISNPYESVIERKAGEYLMLSVSAGQLAIENQKWGSGHGIFTWYLAQGLSGQADQDEDNRVSFFELEQYVKGNVWKEAQKMKVDQTPHFSSTFAPSIHLATSDVLFQTRLQNESMKAVTFSEAIAQARTNQESAWFTDPELFAQFNRLKSKVREKKYLGDDSAEMIYQQLVLKYKAEDINQIRLYYIGALASEGFDAVNRQLNLGLGYKLTTLYYERRLAFLDKAIALQTKQDEVVSLKDNRDLVYCIHRMEKLRSEDNWDERPDDVKAPRKTEVFCMFQ